MKDSFGRVLIDIHRFLSKITILSPFLLLLAHLRKAVFIKAFEGELIKRMPKNWQKMTILDLGCGPCNKERDMRFANAKITCVDIFKPYLKECEKLGFPTVHCDIRDIDKYFKKKSMDIVWLLDVLEHLPKKDGFSVLKKAEEIARRQVIVFCPRGEFLQDMRDGNKYQEHVSPWHENELGKMGYKCRVLRGYHRDIRPAAKAYSEETYPVSADAIWGIKNL